MSHFEVSTRVCGGALGGEQECCMLWFYPFGVNLSGSLAMEPLFPARPGVSDAEMQQKGHKTGKQWSCFRGRHWKYLEESKAGVEATAYLETLCLLMKGKTAMRECEGGLLLKHSHLLQSS